MGQPVSSKTRRGSNSTISLASADGTAGADEHGMEDVNPHPAVEVEQDEAVAIDDEGRLPPAVIFRSDVLTTTRVRRPRETWSHRQSRQCTAHSSQGVQRTIHSTGESLAQRSGARRHSTGRPRRYRGGVTFRQSPVDARSVPGPLEEGNGGIEETAGRGVASRQTYDRAHYA